MKRGATKEEIIRITRELIARNGIRAVRVDEIAQTLGISKRTLYEMFADKNDLVGACLDYMSHQQRERIVACSKRRGGNSLQKVLKLRTNLVMAPSISTAALERAGYLVWNASFSTASETETLSLSPVLSTVGWPTSVWFDGSSASAQSLEKIFSSISELRLRVASETLRPFQSP